MDVFSRIIIEEDIIVPFNYLSKNLNNYFIEYSKKFIEGKCRKEGYIKSNSVSIVSFSNGLLKGDKIYYRVCYEVDACFPYKNMVLTAKIKNITKIGIRAVISDFDNPIVLFVSSEHNLNKNIESYVVGQKIDLKVIDFRFELYDDFISVIAEII